MKPLADHSRHLAEEVGEEGHEKTLRDSHEGQSVEERLFQDVSTA